VAHGNTALGNPDLVDGVSCYLAETTEGFVNRLRRAVEKPDEAAAVAERGYQVYKTRFSPDAAVPPLVEIVRNITAGAALNVAKGISR
jgi:hypothetical protein